MLLHSTQLLLAYICLLLSSNHTYKLTERQEPLSRINFCKRKKTFKNLYKTSSVFVHHNSTSSFTPTCHISSTIIKMCSSFIAYDLLSSITYPSLMMYNQLTTESDTELFNSLEKTLTGIT